jgi:hypothetical protein
MISRWADLNVGWVSVSVTHAGVGFCASTQPTQMLYLIAPSYLGRLTADYAVVIAVFIQVRTMEKMKIKPLLIPISHANSSLH